MVCKKCGVEFPATVEIDGKKVGLHKRSLCLICSPYKSSKNSDYYAWKSSQKQTHLCRDCKQELPISSFYLRKSVGRGDRPQSRCIDCEKIFSTHRSRGFKEWAIELKGGKCKRCGYCTCPDALQFHHRDPLQKDVNPGVLRNWNRDKALVELDKCDLLCANCHAEIHYEIRRQNQNNDIPPACLADQVASV